MADAVKIMQRDGRSHTTCRQGCTVNKIVVHCGTSSPWAIMHKNKAVWLSPFHPKNPKVLPVSSTLAA